jgi:hypothetical protein
LSFVTRAPGAGGKRCYNLDQRKTWAAAVFSAFIMSSRKVVIDGVTYVRSREAARIVCFAPDCTSRLARTYVDIGAIISGPQDDLNLGIHSFVDGKANDNIVIDTTGTGKHNRLHRHRHRGPHEHAHRQHLRMTTTHPVRLWPPMTLNSRTSNEAVVRIFALTHPGGRNRR